MTAPHIPEPELALLASDPDAIAPNRAREIHVHLARCADCADTYDTFVTTFAGEDDETFLASDTSIASLEYGARIARENADADELLRDYLDRPEKAAYRNLASQRKFVHGGVVRRLAKRAFEICAEEPLHALIFADAAITVAQALPEDEYPPNALHDLRGRAWKERANALNRLSQPAAALDALQNAKREYEQVTSNTLGLGNVALVRATAYFYLERLAEASRLRRSTPSKPWLLSKCGSRLRSSPATSSKRSRTPGCSPAPSPHSPTSRRPPPSNASRERRCVKSARS